MAIVQFGNIPADMSDIEDLGYSDYFSVDADPLILSATTTQVILLDPPTGTTIELSGEFGLTSQVVHEGAAYAAGHVLLFDVSGVSIDMDAVLAMNYLSDFFVGDDAVTGGTGNDTLTGFGGDDVIDGGAGFDTVFYDGPISGFTVQWDFDYWVHDTVGSAGTDIVLNVEHLRFADMTVNLEVQDKAFLAPAADVDRLMELYVAFFNRVPDADGMSYWIDQKIGGQTINQIAESFYDAGVKYSSLTGFSADMTNADFVNVVYRNVLGRQDGADADGLAYWTGELAAGRESRGSLVSTILDSAHTFKGNPYGVGPKEFGQVADLLDNKIAVAQTFAIDWGLNYNTPEESIANGMAIAAAITPTDTSAAIALIGIDPGQLYLGY